MKIIKQFRDTDNHVVASIFCEEETGMIMDIWSISTHEGHYLKSVLEYCLDSIEEKKISMWLCNENKLELYIKNEGDLGIEKIRRAIKNSKLEKISMVCRKKFEHQNHFLLDMLEDTPIETSIFSTQVMAMRWLINHDISTPETWMTGTA